MVHGTVTAQHGHCKALQMFSYTNGTDEVTARCNLFHVFFTVIWNEIYSNARL